MEWFVWKVGAVDCFVRVDDNGCWWTKVELHLPGVFILIQKVGMPYHTEDEAKAAAVVTAQWFIAQEVSPA